VRLPQLEIDPAAEADRIADSIRLTVGRNLRKRGVVVAMSGGIDSSVCAALCARALGNERVLGLFLPERDSAAETGDLGQLAADVLGIEAITEDITPMLDAAGCYKRRDDAVRQVVPEYDGAWKMKIVLPSVVETEGYRVFSIVAQAPDGTTVTRRLPADAYLGIVAATNFKQRIRKMMEYYHADRLNYAVVGTPNRLEYDQGFFVKGGDGAADLKPIAHLYKTQVYALAEFLGVPEEIRSRPPTTDTYSMPQGQDEFYFSLPYDRMDICLYGKNNGMDGREVSKAAGLTEEQLRRVYEDIDRKRSTTHYLHMAPVLIDPVPEIGR
jgi:NAD+ synthase